MTINLHMAVPKITFSTKNSMLLYIDLIVQMLIRDYPIMDKYT